MPRYFTTVTVDGRRAEVTVDYCGGLGPKSKPVPSARWAVLQLDVTVWTVKRGAERGDGCLELAMALAEEALK
jgi:hypothetical protein